MPMVVVLRLRGLARAAAGEAGGDARGSTTAAQVGRAGVAATAVPAFMQQI